MATGKLAPLPYSPASLVVTDLSTHPIDQFAVVISGALLPIRFAKGDEAVAHLNDIIRQRAEDKETVNGF